MLKTREKACGKHTDLMEFSCAIIWSSVGRDTSSASFGTWVGVDVTISAVDSSPLSPTAAETEFTDVLRVLSARLTPTEWSPTDWRGLLSAPSVNVSAVFWWEMAPTEDSALAGLSLPA